MEIGTAGGRQRQNKQGHGTSGPGAPLRDDQHQNNRPCGGPSQVIKQRKTGMSWEAESGRGGDRRRQLTRLPWSRKAAETGVILLRGQGRVQGICLALGEWPGLTGQGGRPQRPTQQAAPPGTAVGAESPSIPARPGEQARGKGASTAVSHGCGRL